jgi:alkanesulfonate monooxygenase SsuD/methylene tetrahydromethanopterin reductase-like flavin-dependent oxidoreductase (luciferase family)
VESCVRADRAADTDNWRVAKTVFVAEDDATAEAYALRTDGPYYYYYRSLFNKLKRRGSLSVFKTNPKQSDDSVTLEQVMKQLVIHGSPAKVVDDLLAFKEQTGEFGALLCAGVDWTDPNWRAIR